jgi:CHASE2 domain-containing sensor protein
VAAAHNARHQADNHIKRDMKKDVFISHASEDTEIAEIVCAVLEQEKVLCWIAPRDVARGGEFFDRAIVEAIDACQILVLVLSESANSSRYVPSEVNRAFTNGKRIVVFRIEEDVEPKNGLELYLGRVHWTDGFPPPPEERAAELADIVKGLLDGPSGAPATPREQKPDRATKRSIVEPERRESFTAWAASVSLIMLLTLALFFWDPLRFDETRTVRLDDWYQRLYSTDYPSRADDRLAVVLIDQPTLNEWQTDWPVPYDYLVGIIYRLSCARAAAAFFDLIPVTRYADPEGQRRLADAVRDSSQIGQSCPDGSSPARIPVFFGTVQNAKSPLLDELGSGRGYLFNVETTADPRIYAVGRGSLPARPVQDDETTPAFGLLRRLCSVDSAGPSTTPPSYCTFRRTIGSNSPLALRWSGKVPAAQGAIFTQRCLPAPGFWDRVLFSVYQWNEGTYQLCRPVLTIPAHALISGNILTAAPGTDPVLELMKDRIVLIGVSLPSSMDTVPTPIHERLPGVFFHAMALDNLLTFGDAYPTEPDLPNLIVVLVVLFLSLEAARFLVWRRLSDRTVGRHETENGMRYLIFIPLSTVLVMTCALLPNLLFNANWSFQFIAFVIVLKSLVYYYPVSLAVRLLTARFVRQADAKPS